MGLFNKQQKNEINEDEKSKIEVLEELDNYCQQTFGCSFSEANLEQLKEKSATNKQNLSYQITGIWIKKGLTKNPEDFLLASMNSNLPAENILELGSNSKKLFWEYICNIDALVEPLVFDLLKEMMQRHIADENKEKLFNDIEDIRECGFFTPTAYKGNSDSIKALKIMCLLKEKGSNLKEWMNGNDLMPYDELMQRLRDESC